MALRFFKPTIVHSVYLIFQKEKLLSIAKPTDILSLLHYFNSTPEVALKTVIYSPAD